jgi:hypothetical protein
LQCTAADKKKDKLRSQLNCLKRKEARMEYEERKKERKKTTTRLSSRNEICDREANGANVRLLHAPAKRVICTLQQIDVDLLPLFYI